MQIANSIVITLALSVVPLACGASDVKLEADARWQLEFPDLPDTLATMTTGKKQPACLTVRLPANYSREGEFPLFVFLNGGDGGRGDSLPLDHKTTGSNDFICVNLPLFKRVFDKSDGGLVSLDDFDTVSRAHRIMLQKLLDTIPNITPERSTLGGFSNGAHTTALLVAGQDEFTLRHFRAFYFVEGGTPLVANVLHKAAMKRYRFLLMRGDQSEPETEGKAFTHVTRALEYLAKEHNLDFTFVTMRDTGHDLPPKYQFLLGQWVRGEKMPETGEK
jgi:predicted esterase